MISKELIQRYFEGRCTAQELNEVLRWLDQGEGQDLLEEVAMARWERLYPPRVTEEPGTPVRRAGVTRRALLYGAAASLIGLALGGWGLYRYVSRFDKWRSLTNTSQVVKYCVLPDSTQVWLNPESTISWSMPASGGRHVRLEGQAFLDVYPDADQPFTIDGGPLITEVLGTALNIESYPVERDVRISLVNGSVRVRNGAKANVLHGGQMLTYDKVTGVTGETQLKLSDVADYTSGHLVFSEVPVKVALERLGRLYHFAVHYQQGVHLDNERFSTVFTHEETPSQMIRNILFITPYTYRITDGKNVEILLK